MSMGDPIPLSELARDLPAPVGGWAAELERRGVVVFEDDLGRPAVDRAAARALFAEARAAEVRAARKRQLLEEQLIAADEARRAALPKGIPAGMLPEGSAGLAMMLADPERQRGRRESVLEHSLSNPAGAIIYHTVEGNPTAEAGGQ